MCGIAGIVAEDAGRLEPAVERMLGSLKHRGPDGRGTQRFGNCVLGHTRLSIVDLCTGGQPMISPVSRAAVTFNGEIYGYKDIRALFGDYPFRTTSDTEVILALYDKYGLKPLQYLPGMFAFGIWDEATGELLCARDRFGEKPFYYAFGKNGEFIFASEIKAIIASGLVRPILDLDGSPRIHEAPLRASCLHNIQKHPCLAFCDPSGLPKRERYLLKDTGSCPIQILTFHLMDANEEFERLLDRAVQRQMVADVPVGGFLERGT